jgi:hypothetical protein
LLLSGLLLPLGSAMAGPPEAPQLRIETGNHLALLTRIAVDRPGWLIATASEDKTIRLWAADNGRPLLVVRPPIGSGNQGDIYALAFSPDGRTIAAGGNAGFDGDSHSLYLFERATGKLRKGSTLSGLESPVQQLAWSPDGQFIAVGLRQGGLRIFDRALHFIGSDPEYNEAIYGADFARDGRLAVASLDGAIRLYQVDRHGVKRLARQHAAGGLPYSLAFAPDGATLAVGYQTAPKVDLYDATTLEPRHSASYGGNGNLGRVAWSTDGRTLYAAGTLSRNGRFPLIAFANAGQSEGRELYAFGNIVTSLAARPGGGVLAASAEPSWAALDGEGRLLFEQKRQSGDFRDAGDAFRVSADGSRLNFPFAAGGRETAGFDLNTGNLGPATPPGTAAPLTRAGGAELTHWKNSTRPELNGRALALLPNEVAHSAALSSNGDRAVIGTEWFLRGFDRDGNPLWQTRLPAAAWAVNVSGDGKWALAALGDGTIRWYRLGDGAEQLALFPNADRERWIVWTPSGYYDTSLNGEWLIGWHLNRGANRQADYYPAGRFRKQFYRPDVLQKILASADERTALRQANAESAAQAPQAKLVQLLPPLVEVQSERQIESAATQLPLRFSVRVPADAPATEVKIRVNGELVQTLNKSALPQTRGDEAPVLERSVKLPVQDATVEIVARNRNGVSEPVTVTVKRPAATASEPVKKSGNLYALVVGVSNYPHLKPDMQLQYAAKDAQDFGAALKKSASPLFKQVQFRTLTNGEATHEKVLEGLKWLRDSVQPEDMAVLFLAGHGVILERQYFFVSADFDMSSPATMRRTGVPDNALQDTLQNLKGRSVFFVDTCHSGFVLPDLKVNTDMTGTLNEMGDEKSVVVLTAAAGRQFSFENSDWGNGAFTKALIEGLNGKAPQADAQSHVTTPVLLHSYVSRRVKQLTDSGQTPKMIGAVFDDPIAVIAP